jgi:ABC-type Fe3+/spermidine/putrescine transport system ATPase subunit
LHVFTASKVPFFRPMPLRVDKLSKRYGNNWALRDVSFEVDDGSVIGLFGASGSGKSTLLRLMAGTIKGGAGAIELDGRDLGGVKRKERSVVLHGDVPKPGIGSLFPGFFAQGSSGEEALARFEDSAGANVRVWLLDEPFRQMDAAQRSRSFDTIRRSAKARGRIVLFASSSFEQIVELSDEVAVIDRGEIIQTGTPQEIYDAPLTVKVARAAGDVNLINARRLTSSDADLPEFYTLDGAHRLFAQRTDKSRLGAINQDATLAIRPEQVTMSLGSSFPEDNLLRGVVKAIRFRGPTCIIEFDAGGLRLMTRVFRVVGLEVGDECMLGLPPHRISILTN